ncbi:hypothetical protein FMM02_08305 [Sphingomonas xanthus]|uniref:PepSY domain-containing protein n=2 Tax=Sphingomonas xanthus TaxID=2594473 RepID=A0A516IUH2_9SPHN|nr:hypothetical protein FMM02_08305 [Sphingomonas xanthus]
MQHVARPVRFWTQPIFWRRIHKWVGLILGLQFVLWTVSGAVMALLDKDKVGGHSAAAPIEVSAPWPSNLVPAKSIGPVREISMRWLLDRPIYEAVRGGGDTAIIDARTGRALSISGPMAGDIARKAFHHDAPIVSTEWMAKSNLEARDHAGPMWRVNFADAENSSSYVSAVTGRPLVNRGDTWRTWDFVWMLHNMDYVNRSSFNHPLIIFVAFGTLWLAFTGFYLLFKSFRRREFRWLLGREKQG